MHKIAAVTGTRAEYGLLKNILKEIVKDTQLELQLIVTGTHLSEQYGYTIKEIKNDGFYINECISMLMDSNSKESTVKSMGLALIQYAQAFNNMKPDILLILGDRYEIFAAATTAMMMNIPIAHISGGEITEGAIDEQIRHAITKMAHIHFSGAEIYAKNIMNMGEEAWRIFNVGDPGIENIRVTQFMTKEQLKDDLKVEIDEQTLLITYHPVTLEIDKLQQQIDNLIKVLDKLNKNMIITYPNADQGGKYIIGKLEAFAKRNAKVYLFKSLGIQRYLSVMKLCGAVVGNSSSALIEAPFLKVPVVNIGNRQNGRLMADNIIPCTNDCEDIFNAVNQALSTEFREKVKCTKSLYGEGSTSKEIVKVLKNIEIDDKLVKKKLVWS
ncbi:MAG: UDP-N-acetylglucosamine 2-epimerase [Marinisporobacter sp.]|jgi:GDP/UDP-N,N'-diacetylbacillosamine 2-epimerase (hydrolysing)|nr:UDP-N-acetylglucosamine 2-epimerase [Marinisporobacter sp.]